MRRFLPPILAGVLLLTLQTTLWSAFSIQNVRPDLLLILVLYLALSSSPISGGILAFSLGYLMDLFSGNTIGLYALSRPLVFYGVRHFRSRFYLEGLPFQFFFVFMSVLAEGVFVYFLWAGLSRPSFSFHVPLSFGWPLIAQALFTGLAAPFCFLFFDKAVLFFSKKGQEKG